MAQGANAVVGVRFSAVGRDMAFEVLAYGTAVVLI
ncbi:MAG: heavy metal-binding domain-containing protein [Thermaerobacter sp.]|nr:heavy metal-binding domain-containing protein [Thermaerobacter sp.]